MTEQPQLLLVAHGSRDPAAATALEALRDAVKERLPQVDVALTWIEWGTPLLADVLASRDPGLPPPVVVPALLARGTHLVRDLPSDAAGTGPGAAWVTPPLGPDPMLTEVLIEYARAAGVAPGQPLVLAATGTKDPAGLADVHQQAAWLQDAWGAPVRAGFVTAAPAVTDAADELEALTGSRPAVVGYFLAPGRLPAASGAVTAPLAGPPLTAALVVSRYTDRCAG